MIPQTLLWVGLVIAWLVVLVPMLVARHPKVNTVTDATLKTRLLHRGGSARTALRRKIRPPATVAATPEGADPAFAPADAAVDVDLDADEDIEELSAPSDDELSEALMYVDADVADNSANDSDGPLDGDTTPIVTVQRAAIAEPTPEPERVTHVVEKAPDEAEADEVELEPEQVTHVVEAEADADAEPQLELELDEIEADESLTEEVATVERPAPESESESESEDAEHHESSLLSGRRGGFDPESDARLSAARYRFRQRITLVFSVLAVVTLAAGWLGVPYAWYALGAVIVGLVGYLVYLRRTVNIETEIRRRRLARLERARRERAREAEVIDGVPAHLRRYGAIVMEIDDEDPAFDHLPRYRSEEFDFLQPRPEPHRSTRSERRAEVREAAPRKVG